MTGDAFVAKMRVLESLEPGMLGSDMFMRVEEITLEVRA